MDADSYTNNTASYAPNNSSQADVDPG